MAKRIEPFLVIELGNNWKLCISEEGNMQITDHLVDNDDESGGPLAVTAHRLSGVPCLLECSRLREPPHPLSRFLRRHKDHQSAA